MADPTNFDDLLDLTPDDEAIFGDLISAEDTVEEVAPVEEIEEDSEDAYIRQMEEELAKPLPASEDEVLPDEPSMEKTAKQLRIEELEDQLARRNAAKIDSASVTYSRPTGKGAKVLIHIVEDGFTALGSVWYRGQEIEFEIPGIDYDRTKDINGNSWVDIAGDLSAQYARWGKQYLALGPFVARPGEKFEDEVAAEDARRGRAVPMVRG